MTWTTPGTAVPGQVLTSTYLNTQLRDNLNALRRPPMVKLGLDSSISPFTGNSIVSFSTADYDTDNMWDSGNPSRINFRTPGVYLIQIYLVFTATSAPTWISVETQVSSGLNVRRNIYWPYTLPQNSVSFVDRFTTNSHLRFLVGVSGGSGFAVLGSSVSDTGGANRTTYSATFLGDPT
jgi:hypothetical protein